MKNTAPLRGFVVASVGPLLCCVGAAAGRPDLHNNGAFVTNSAVGAGGADVSLVQDSLGCQTYGFQCQGNPLLWRAADDFTVTAPGGWTVSSVVFFAFQPGSGTSTPTISSVNLRVWSGRPGDAGSVLLFGNTTTNRLVGSSWTGTYRVSEPDMTSVNRPIFAVEAAISPALTLPPGTYWLDWQASGSLPSGPYVVPVTSLGSTGAPGANARLYSGSAGPWINARDSGTSVQQELAFIVRGTVGGGAPACYPNCDASTTAPCLNVLDFGCFLNKFSAGDTTANCDHSTVPPVLNVLDFGCYLNAFAAGCSGC